MQVSHGLTITRHYAAIDETQTYEGMHEDLDKVSNLMRWYAIAEDIYLRRRSLPLQKQLSRAIIDIYTLNLGSLAKSSKYSTRNPGGQLLDTTCTSWGC